LSSHFYLWKKTSTKWHSSDLSSGKKKAYLAKESEPVVFVSRQEFSLEGKKYERTGLIAALRLLQLQRKTWFFPHEFTYKGAQS